MKEISIKAENLSKQYRLGQVGTGTLSHDLNRWWHSVRGKEDPYLKIGENNDRTKKGETDYVWALSDINFEITRGDAVGIIGRNGAGKSTLLKILSKVTQPTTGNIKLNGRVASLLEVGTGFHPEMTGRENIFLNGAILGMTRREIKRKFDEIVEFAGVARYIDTPVKRYSSGMYVRLAFAVAAHLESEILIVDEVLAVGDAEFQKKCLGKMQEVSKGEGRTVLFVSHNMGAIRTLCGKGIFLKNGMISFSGEANETISHYLGHNISHTNWVGEDGDNNLKIIETKISELNGNTDYKNTTALNVSIKIKSMDTFNDLVIGFTLHSVYGSPIASVLYNDFNNIKGFNEGTYEICFLIPPCTLAPGEYEIEFNLSIPYVKRINTNRSNLSFRIIADSEMGNKFFIENSPNYNSLIRPNWFQHINKLN